VSGVPAEARSKQKLKVLIDARRLCKYSLTILQNNNSFKARPSGNEDADLKNPSQPELVPKINYKSGIEGRCLSMVVRDTNFYRKRGLSPRERIEMDNMRADLARERQHNAELETALVELADLYAQQDDAIVELAEIVGGEM